MRHGDHGATAWEGAAGPPRSLATSLQTDAAVTWPPVHDSILSASRSDASRLPLSISESQLWLDGERPSATAHCSSVSP